MYNVGDLIDVKGCIHIVTKVINGYADEGVSLKDYIQDNYVISHEGEQLTLTELTNRLMDEYCKQKQFKA